MFRYIVPDSQRPNFPEMSSACTQSPAMFKHSVCEVRSSFYTNNPLLYISHYSEIIVTSGYDATQPAGMLSTQLSSRRELVEQLDSEPLFDYLVQNGALERPTVDEIKNEKSAAKINIALLKHLEGNGKSALNLLINALRQTGQHHLASLLDDGARIKQLTGSGYLSRQRHKGQVSLQIEIKALKLIQEVYDRPVDHSSGKLVRSATYTFSREWISLEDIKSKIAELMNPLPSLQFDVGDGCSDDLPKKQNSCFCMCFSRIFSRRKGSDGGPIGNGHPGEKYMVPPAPSNGYKLNNHQVAAQLNKETVRQANVKNDLESLKNLAEMFRQKADILNSVLRDPASHSQLQLVKYFEQDRGVLVLETNCEDGFVIVNICMKLSQLEHLRQDYHNGKLNKDIENCIVSEEVLQKVGCRGIKLSSCINPEDFDLAEQELQ